MDAKSNSLVVVYRAIVSDVTKLILVRETQRKISMAGEKVISTAMMK